MKAEQTPQPMKAKMDYLAQAAEGAAFITTLAVKAAGAGDGVVIIEYKLNPLPEEDG